MWGHLTFQEKEILHGKNETQTTANFLASSYWPGEQIFVTTKIMDTYNSVYFLPKTYSPQMMKRTIRACWSDELIPQVSWVSTLRAIF